MAANAMQMRVHNWHRQVATRLGFGQSTVKHRQLQGSLSTTAGTGNVVYSAVGPQATDETTTDTLVWAIWQQKLPRTTEQDDIAPGKTIYENWIGQFPVFDDSGNLVPYADEDWLVDNNGNRYKIQNTKIDPSLSFVTCELERLQ